MDSITHILLGGAIAQLAAGRRAGYTRTFFLGALAATFPDFDVFFHTGDVMRDHALHRHFMHSLVIVPLLSFLSLAPFLLQKSARPFARPLYFAALLACFSHTLLDALTSFGTMMFWPFTDRRIALDIIAVVDPAFTLPLLAGTLIALFRRSRTPAAIALALSLSYLGLAFLQHARAQSAQQHLLAARNIAGAHNSRILPQIGSVLTYRSLYIHDDRAHTDALRIPLFSQPLVKIGGSQPLVDITDLRPFPATPAITQDFDMFAWFSDGYVVRLPSNPLILSDLRYATTPEGTESVWGLQLEESAAPQWHMLVRTGYTRTLLRDLFSPKGYLPITPSPKVP